MPPKKNQPWFKAWVKDILADAELRSVPMAARGFWVYLMCLMHKSPRKGYLLQENGHPYSNEQLAAISGCSTEEAAHLYQSLITSAVFSVSEHGFVYSRRMVRESKISDIRSDAGRKGVFAKQTKKGDFCSAKDDQNEFCLANAQQTPQQNVSNALVISNSVHSYVEGKKGDIPNPRDGGVGEGNFAEAKRKQNPSIDFELTDAGLAQMWVFYSTACAGRGKRDKEDLIAPMIGQTVANGVPREVIRDAIRSTRNRNEWYSEFESRLKKAAKPPPESREQRQAREREKMKKLHEEYGNT